MANEITVVAGLQVANGNLNHNTNLGTKRYNQSVIGGPVPGMLNIGTTEESVSLAELSTAGWAVFQNLDSTNYVEWGFSTGVYGGKMGPGESAGPFRLKPGTSLFMKANIAACKVLINVLEN